jgi:hypothetical protein
MNVSAISGAALACVMLRAGGADAQCASETEQGRRLVVEFATACPQYRQQDVEYVRYFFTSPLSVEFREMFGLTGIAAEEVRPLAGEGDAETCRRMSQAMRIIQDEEHPKYWSGFQAGKFYVMKTWVDVPPGVWYVPASTGIIIFDTEMRLIVATR